MLLFCASVVFEGAVVTADSVGSADTVVCASVGSERAVVAVDVVGSDAVGPDGRILSFLHFDAFAITCEVLYVYHWLPQNR